jgi:broad specificity phosphatase PhoE
MSFSFTGGNRVSPAFLYLLRHAESVVNELRPGYCFNDEESKDETRRLSGGTLANQDAPITMHGIEQAREAGPRVWSLVGVPDVIFCSPHLRTRQTLDLVLESWPDGIARPPIIHDPRVRERESAPVSNMTLAEVRRHFPWIGDYHDEVGEFYFRYPSGESLVDLVDGRARSFLDDVHRVYGGANVLVVTHGNFIKCARMLLEDWLPDQLRKSGHVNPANCGVVAYRRECDSSGIARLRLHSIT